MKRLISLILIILISIIISACGGKETAKDNGSNGKSVENFSFYGDKQTVVFTKTPQKALVCSTTALDTLIALGVGQAVHTAVLTEGASVHEYQKLLPNTKLYSQPLQLEAVTEIAPDMIIGWRRFFADRQLGNSTTWINKGVPAYIQDASGPIPAKGKFPPCTVESEINFIRNMGIIFDKRSAAEKLIKDINAKLEVNSVAKKERKVLVVEFLNGSIEVFGSDLLPGDIVKKLGGKVIEYGNPFVSQEVIVSNDADYIFVVYHGGKAEEKAALDNFNNSLYRNMPAVVNKKVYPLNYKLIVAPAVNVVTAVEYMRKCLEI